MSVVANVGINLDARAALQQLRAFYQQSQSAGQAAQQLQTSTDKLQSAFTKQRGSTAELAKRLRDLKTEYERLTASAKESARAGGEGFSAATVGRLRKLSSEINSTREAFLNSKAAAANYKAELDKVANSSQKVDKASKGVSGSLGRVGGVIASIGAGALVAGMVRGAAATEQLQLRLKLLSGEYGETARVQQFVSESAKTFGQSQVEAAGGVADVYARLRPLGVSLDQIETIYKGFNATALASGTSAEAASGAFLQLSQALGSGTLQGDEFRSIAEQVPGILRLVASEMGVTVGELKKLGSEGKITSDILINALAKGFDENSSKIKALLDQSPAQRFKEFKDSTQALSNALGSELLPAIVPIVKQATELLRLFGSLPGPVKTLAAAVLGVAGAFVVLAPAISAVVGLMSGIAIGGIIAAGPWIALAAGVAAAAYQIYQAANAQQQFNDQIAFAPITEVNQKIIQLQDELAGAEEKLLQTQGQFGALSREAVLAEAKVDALRGALEQAQGDYRIRLLYQEVGVTPVSGYYGPGFKAPKQEAKPKPTVATNRVPAPVKTSGGSGTDKAAREAEQLKQQTAQQLQVAKDLQFTQANQLLQLRAKSDFERTFVEFGIKRSEIERKYNELLQQSKSAEETKLLQQARAAEYKQSSITLEQRALELTKQATQPLDDILKNLQDQAAYQREYGELIKNGTNPELAKQIIEINRAYEASVAALEPAIAAAQAAVTKAEAEGASATEIEKYRKELERIQEIRGGLEGKRGQAIGAAKEGAAKQPTVIDGIGERIKQLKDDLNPVKVATDSIVNGADAIGQAFGQAFQDVATGAKSTQEALADAFKGIGQAFISMATEIIAKQLTLILLQTILNALSGGGTFSTANKNLTGTGALKSPSAVPGLKVGAYAEGGFVTGPTNALIGEGGEPEYVIPASKMRTAMARYSSGARGSAVIPGNGDDPAASGGGVATAAPIDVRYSVERINNVDYVTADQFQRGMAQAAQQGAIQGERRAMRSLKNSASTRRSVGI